MYDVAALRQREFPLTASEIYFNNASIAPVPSRTSERVSWAIAQMSEHPWRFFQDHYMPLDAQLRADLAALINAAGAHEIVNITSTSGGLGAVARALPWQAGDNVLLCGVEFPANAFPWLELDRLGVKVRQVPAAEGGLTLDAMLPLVDDRTRLVSASAIQFFTGHRTNLDAIGAFCHDNGILFVVDAIQAIGHMSFDVEAMHIDVLASGGQKSLLATPGTGFMYVRAAVAEKMRPWPIGPNATVDFRHWLDYDRTPLPGAARFAMGTSNMSGWCGVAASLSLLTELGIDNIDRHTRALAAEARAMLERHNHSVITPAGAGPIVTFASGVGAEETDRLVSYLQARHVTVVKHVDRRGIPHIRLSFHAYNTVAELHEFEQVLCDGYAAL